MLTDFCILLFGDINRFFQIKGIVADIVVLEGALMLAWIQKVILFIKI